jgi:NADH dehydrogenase (ubiquinone) Fe-S protein 6
MRRWKSSKKISNIDTPTTKPTDKTSKSLLESTTEISSLSSESTTRPAIKLPLTQESSIELSANKKSLLKRKWTTSMRTKEGAFSSPAFEHVILETQPFPKPAIDLVHQEPVFKTDKRVIYCDGGHGALGHPRVYINLDKPENSVCGYCGKEFVRIPGHPHKSHA